MIAFAALATIAYSQTDDKGYEEGKCIERRIRPRPVANSDDQLVSRRRNSVAGNAYLNGSLTHKNGNWLWVTNLVLDYGLTKPSRRGCARAPIRSDFPPSWAIQRTMFGSIH